MRTILVFCLFWASYFSLYGQAPEIAYPSLVVYTENQPIIPLQVANTGGAVPEKPVVSTFAGSGLTGAADGTAFEASFNLPTVVTPDHSGNLIVVDRMNHKIRKIAADGTVTTIAGTGAYGSVDGPADTATFRYPDGAVVDSHGNIFITDQGNSKIRKITPEGMVSTFAGTGVGGFQDGDAANAQFYYPAAMDIDSNDVIYIADWYNNKIRKITPEGIVSTLAGSVSGFADGEAALAQFNGPTGLCVDDSGNVYVADYANHRIRKIDTFGVVTTLAGSGTAGSEEGQGTSASFYHPAVVTIDKASQTLYVTDQYNNKIRKISPSGLVSSYAGSGAVGAVDGLADTSSFNNETGICIVDSKTLFICDYGNNKIRKISSYSFTVTPELPLGLVLNPASGEITGTPIVVSPPTNYTITAENQYGSSTAVVSIEVQAVMGLSEFGLQSLRIYPNPVKHQFSVTSKEKVLALSIRNSFGQEIKRVKGDFAAKPIDVSDCPSGVYFCRITTDNGTQEIKLLKQ
ncbi:T9SS type A sorting domain-containing protein [Flavobacterium sp. SM15]|uniref:T9SS type A sorting domain-containing protein n=1 Tax=Flavobacterium sp. SM15 TaxID=2908005 RepID=UPI001EDC5D73|nr:T9SS type A sorting domain-containing protein [Flavobacterium sp. SM15]MCG2612277.1 T9SS type A sorting domain-containing protein [Flavobacterium sp. SM15]